jgi:phosphotransferase system  glucose/maltose/N-acetylglucosamine-specific IIC component
MSNAYLYAQTWGEVFQSVQRQAYQEDVFVCAQHLPHPAEVGFKQWLDGSYRMTLPDGKSIDIKEDNRPGYYRVHWEWFNPARDLVHLIQHGIYDAPEVFVSTLTAIGAAIGYWLTKKKEDAIKGALLGASISIVLTLLTKRKEIEDGNKGL